MRTRPPFFFLVMALAMAVLIAIGFSYTVGENLLRPAWPRPAILYVHALVAGAWIPLLIVQASLVRAGRVDLHRCVAAWGVVHAALIPTLGLATAVAMAHARLAHGEDDAAVSFPIPVNDALAFSVAFGLALAWRRRPEFHRRFAFVASCVLMAPAFGRMPALDHAEWFYAGVDVLVALGALRDRLAFGRVHAVYLVALPALVAAQATTAAVRWSPWWLAHATALFA